MTTLKSTTKHLTNLIEFQQTIYEHVFVNECDAQYELLTSMLVSGPISSFPELSQSPAFQRQWSSAYQAIRRGTQDRAWLTEHLSQQVPADSIFALDCSSWVHPSARVLDGQQFTRVPSRGVTGHAIAQGHVYSALAYIPERRGHFAPPISTVRVLGDQTPVECGIAQVKKLREARPASHDIVTGDGSYGNHDFFGGVQAVGTTIVARLRCDRVLYGPPPPYAGRGRPRVHGARFDFKDPTTWSEPDEALCFDDEHHGQVHLSRWSGYHAKQGATVPFEIIRAETHLERDRPPKPIWLGCVNAETYTVQPLWCAFDCRWTIEPAFAFRKQQLHWTLPRFQQADRCDRWTCLVDLAYWTLFLVRELAPDKPLPWQKPQAVLTPGRVKQGVPWLFGAIALPTRPVQTRGKSPGWTNGRPRTPLQRHKVKRKRPKQVKQD
jgi:hypothetical protein